MLDKAERHQGAFLVARQLAHHAVGGCKMECGDLPGSGTISGPDRGAFGLLLELTWGGKEPVEFEPVRSAAS